MLMKLEFIIMHMSSRFKGHQLATLLPWSVCFLVAPQHILAYISNARSWICCSVLSESVKLGPVWKMFSQNQDLKQQSVFQNDWQIMLRLWCRLGLLSDFSQTIFMSWLILEGSLDSRMWRQNKPLRYRYPLSPYTDLTSYARQFSTSNFSFCMTISFRQPTQSSREKGQLSPSLRAEMTLQRLLSCSTDIQKLQL